jgi:holo-[acyl-carrier protein] synthase
MPAGHRADIALTITDEYPLAQAMVIISALREADADADARAAAVPA